MCVFLLQIICIFRRVILYRKIFHVLDHSLDFFSVQLQRLFHFIYLYLSYFFASFPFYLFCDEKQTAYVNL